ncbi:MAG: 4-hydroxythreonine-4-phosphate dehydrogenase PdxA [Candidatus Latescibacteria bacterium]|nr:4-hydroxythreonine-4-phosphate dehydrogenase PdxA [Candidatus Latescibacterota bacterium]
MNRPIIGITIGDPAGIGPEITIKALMRSEIYDEVRPLVFGDRSVLEQALAMLDGSRKWNVVEHPGDGKYEAGTLDFIDVGAWSGPVSFGTLQPEAGRAAYAYLTRAIEDALEGRIEAICTAPINKESLRAAGIPYVDHTAILKHQTGVQDIMGLFIVRALRIFFLTRHIAFRDIPKYITHGRILHAVRLCDRYLRELDIADPHVAVAALNPHGGEHGLFGTEEEQIIAPAIQAAKKAGLRVSGPVPADAVFHQASEGKYDGVLSLYHDQGHVAAKTLEFRRAVALTMGLPFLRTSVDHGTAFDIAGEGIADETGMVEAVKVAGKYGKSVREHQKRET